MSPFRQILQIGEPGRFRYLIITLLPALLIFSACDSSESDTLLNPPLPDSLNVRVLNLTDGSLTGLSIGGLEVASSLASRKLSSVRSVWFTDYVDMIVTTSLGSDTIRNQRLPVSIDDEVLLTIIVSRLGDSTTTTQIVASRTEAGFLTTSGEGRVYFFNAVDGRTLFLREGCRSGRVAFAASTGPKLAGSGDYVEGDYSFFLFEETEEQASGRVSVSRGEIVGLIALPDGNGGVELRSIDLGASSAASNQGLAAVLPEDRTTGTLTLINGLTDNTVDVEINGSGQAVATGLAAGEVSTPSVLEVCQNADGDSLHITASDGRSVVVGFSADVGSSLRLVIFDDGSGIRVVELTSPEGGSEDRVKLRAINLASSDTAYSIVVGAGAPDSLGQGALLIPTLRGGRLSSFRTLSPGLYPLSIDYSSSGFFVDGGLQRFVPGVYTLMILEGDSGPSIRVLSESNGTTRIDDLEIAGRQAILYSTHPGTPVEIRVETSSGTLVVPDVAYSYVYPTIVPEETVRVSAAGVTSDVVVGSAGSIIGWTGQRDQSGSILWFDRLERKPGAGRAFLRFLNGIPNSAQIAFRNDSAKGPVVAAPTFPTPTEEIDQEARRYTYVLTPEGTNDELARITALQLSERRSYVLMVVPSGETSTSGREYSTLLLQE